MLGPPAKRVLGYDRPGASRHIAPPLHLPLTPSLRERQIIQPTWRRTTRIESRKKALLTVFEVRVNLPERLGATDVGLHIASGA